MTERLPTVKEINPYGCLDGNVAANNLYGFNQEQAYELLVENEAHYTEDYLWMGEVAFTYYAQVLLMYVERAERGEHSSFVLHVLDVFQSHFEGDQSGLEYKSEIARSFCMRVLKDFSYYGFGDDDPVFQTPPRILCREVHKLDEVMQKISKDDSLPLMLDSVEASLPKKKSVKSVVRKIKQHLQCRVNDETYLVGVSGGRDSVVLLDVLFKCGFENLVVVHVNHQLRGDISDGDEEFVRALAESFDLPFYTESVDVGALAFESKKGLELAAREVRHAVFARAAKKHSAAGVFLGHHADDHAETVLYNLLRGSNGLKGIRFENSIKVDGLELKLIRPLLEVRRSEIDSYIAEHQLKFREDATNGDPFTARNRIRNEVMPLLQEIMQREVVPAINSAAEVSLSQSDFIIAQSDYEAALDPQGRLFLPALVKAPAVIQEALLMRYLKEHNVTDLSRSLVLRCLELCDTSKPAKVNLPGARWLRRKEQRLFIV